MNSTNQSNTRSCRIVSILALLLFAVLASVPLTQMQPCFRLPRPKTVSLLVLAIVSMPT